VITAVLDTNVLASGFVRPEPPPGRILAAWQAGTFLLVVSHHILAELEHTFEEPYFATRLSPARRRANLALVREEAIIAPLKVRVQDVATHPEDDLILATAVSARVDYLVTGDKKLQALKTYRGVRIVSPPEFLEILAHQENPL